MERYTSGSADRTSAIAALLDRRLQVVRFQTAGGPARRIAFLTLTRRSEGEESTDWQFDLPVGVKGEFLWTALYALAVAALLAGPQLYSIWSNPNLPQGNAVNATIITAVFTLLAGIFAAFVLKKPW